MTIGRLSDSQHWFDVKLQRIDCPLFDFDLMGPQACFEAEDAYSGTGTGQELR